MLSILKLSKASLLFSITIVMMLFSQEIRFAGTQGVFTEGGNAVLIAPGLTVTGNKTISEAKVVITDIESGDRLASTASLPNGIAVSWDSTKAILKFTGDGTPAQYQEILRGVTFQNTISDEPVLTNREIVFSIGSALYFAGTGHFYEYIPAHGITWDAARDSAKNLNINGIPGYLLTITSASELGFLSDKINSKGWLGGSDATTPDKWYWMDGPEAGIQFWEGKASGHPVNNAYTNWHANEPNDYKNTGESYLHAYPGGEWNDFRGDDASIEGFFVEYGGQAGDPEIYFQITIDFELQGVNDIPFLVGNISDVTIDENTAPFTLGNLDTIFSDRDVEDTSLTYTIQNTHPSIANISVSATGNLVVSPVADSNGSAQVIVRATDIAGAFVEDTFDLMINSTNHIPVAGFGTSLKFDGVDDRAFIPNYTAPTGNFTFEMWVKPASLAVQYKGFFGNALNGYEQRSPSLWQYGTGLHYDMRLKSDGNQRNFDIIPNFFTEANTWVHIAWVKDGTTMKFYRNGKLFYTRDSCFDNGTYVTHDTLIFGALDNNYDANFDEVRVWNIARTEQQINDYQYKSLGDHPDTISGLLNYWTLNDGSGTSAIDLAGNSTVDLQNGVQWESGGTQPGITVAEDTPYTGYLKATDDDNDPLVYTISYQDNLHGTVTINNSTGQYTYTPDTNFTGTAQLTFFVTDPEGAQSNSIDLDIVVEPVNDAPIIDSSLEIIIDEDSVFQLDLAYLYWHDPDNIANDISVIVLPDSNYTVSSDSVTGEQNIITPKKNFYGTLNVKVMLNDGAVNSPTSKIVPIKITPINDAPNYISIRDTSTLEDTPIYLDRRLARYNNIDLDVGLFLVVLPPIADEYTVEKIDTIITKELDGSPLTLTTDSVTAADTIFFTYKVTPKANSNDTIEVRTRMSDWHERTSDSVNAISKDIRILRLAVTPVNDTPTLNAEILDVAVDEDAAPIANLVNLNTIFTDVDDDSLLFTVTTTSGNHNLVTPAIDSSILSLTFTPNAYGTDTIIVKAADIGNGSISASDTFTVTVNPINDAPTIVNPIPDTSILEDFGTIHYRDLNSIFTDIEQEGALHFTATSLHSKLSPTISNNDSVLILTSIQDMYGVDTLIVTATDSGAIGNDIKSVSDTFEITIAAVNDAPVITDAHTLHSFEDSVFQFNIGQLTYTDVDSDPSELGIKVLPGDHYTVVPSDPTKIQPDNNYYGTIKVKVQLTDSSTTGSGDTVSNIYEVDLILSNINDGPNYKSVRDTSTLEDTPIYLDRRLADYDNIDLDRGLFLQVLPSANNEYTIEEIDTMITKKLNGDPLTVTDTSSDLDTIFFTYKVTPKTDTNGIINIRTRMSDWHERTNDSINAISADIRIIHLQVTPVNDTPTIAHNIRDVEVQEDAATDTIVDLNNIFSDVEDGTNLSFSVSTTSGNYNLVTPAINLADSSLILTFDPNAFGDDTLIVTATDSDGASVNDTVEVKVNPVNDVPTIVSAISDTTLLEDFTEIVYRNLNTVFSDIESEQSLQYSFVVKQHIITPSINDSNLVFTSILNKSGVDTLIISATDDSDVVVKDTTIIAVTPVNDAPVITSVDTIPIYEDEQFVITLGSLHWSDVDNDISDISVIVTDGEHYTHIGDTITPELNWPKDIVVRVYLTDGDKKSDTVGVPIAITQVNDAPHINGIISGDTTNEDTPIILTRELVDYHNIDKDRGLHLVIGVSEDNSYTVRMIDTTITTDSDGNPLKVEGTDVLDTVRKVYELTPKPNFNGEIKVPIYMRDPYDATSPSDTVILTVLPVNDTPYVAEDIKNKVHMEDFGFGDSINLNRIFEDVESGDSLTYSVMAKVGVVAVDFDKNTSELTVNSVLNAVGTDTILMTASDGELSVVDTFLVIVSPINDKPVISQIDTISIVEEQTIIITLDSITKWLDVDNDTSDISIILHPGTDYRLVGPCVTAGNNFDGVLAVPVNLYDGIDTSDIDTLYIKVANVNDSIKFIDSDGDGIPDYIEDVEGTDKNDFTDFKDTDGDGVADYIEGKSGTNGTDASDKDDYPFYKDSDGDGVLDYIEDIQGTDKNNKDDFLDSDGDGVADYIEGENDTDPFDKDDFLDSDGDGVPDYVEDIQGTDKNDKNSFKDTDGDGIADYVEEANGENPFINGVGKIEKDELLSKDSLDNVDIVADLSEHYLNNSDSSFVISAISLDSSKVIPHVIIDDSTTVDGYLSFEYGYDKTGYATVIVSIVSDGNVDYDTIEVYIKRVAQVGDVILDNDFGHSMSKSLFSGIAVTPNPAPKTATQVVITSETKGADEVHIKIFDALGELVEEGNSEINGTIAEYKWNIGIVRSYVGGKAFVAFITYKKDGRVIDQSKCMLGIRK